MRHNISYRSTCLYCNISYFEFYSKVTEYFNLIKLNDEFAAYYDAYVLAHENMPCISDDEYIIKKLIE